MSGAPTPKTVPPGLSERQVAEPTEPPVASCREEIQSSWQGATACQSADTLCRHRPPSGPPAGFSWLSFRRGAGEASTPSLRPPLPALLNDKT